MAKFKTDDEYVEFYKKQYEENPTAFINDCIKDFGFEVVAEIMIKKPFDEDLKDLLNDT